MQREYIEIKEGLVGKKTLFQSISFKGMMAKTKAEEQKLENASKKREKESFLDTEARAKDDPLTSYRQKEPMAPAKIKEHEPTAVKRVMTEKIVERGQTGTDAQEAAEIARKKGMAKGTTGASETGSQYEQGAAGTNKTTNK